MDQSDVGQPGISTQFKYVLTASTCFSYLGYGMVQGVVGTTLIDVKDLLHATMEDISSGLMVRYSVYCLGSLMCAWLFTKFNRQIGFAFNLIGFGLGLICIPLLPTMFGYFVANGILGFSGAGIDVASNALMLEIWRESANPYMQSLHFSYAVGSIIGPLVAEPFLSPIINRTATVDNSTIMIDFYNVTATATKNQVYIPFSICGGTLFLAASAIIVLYIVKPYKNITRLVAVKKTVEDDESVGVSHIDDREETSSLISGSEVKSSSKSYIVLVILFASLFFNFESGLETNFFTYLETFVVNVDLKLTKERGAFLNSAASAAYCAGRFVSILVATKFSAKAMLYFDSIVMVIGSAIIWFYANSSETGLWFGVVVLGFGCASCFPTIYAYSEERINVTNVVCGIFMFANSVSSVIVPLLEGKYIETRPTVFNYINIACAVGSLIFYLCLQATDLLKKSDNRNANNHAIQEN